jgi:hypothetical protein
MATSQQFMDGGDGNTSFGGPKSTKEKEPDERRGKSDMDEQEPMKVTTMPALPKPIPDAGDTVPTYTGQNGVFVNELPDGSLVVTGPNGQKMNTFKPEDADKAGQAAIKAKLDGALRNQLASGTQNAPVDGVIGALIKTVGGFIGQSEEEKAAQAEKMWQELLRENDMDPAKALAAAAGDGLKPPGEAAPVAGGSKPPPPPDTEFRSGKTSPTEGGSQSPATTAPVQAKTPEQVAQEAKTATQTAEQKRFDDLVKLYAPNAKGFSPLDITTASTPKEAEAVKKMNDLIALSAKSGAIGDKAKADLSNLSKLTPENRDAWLAYYNPSAAVSSGASASGASASAAQGQATLASMAPTEVGEVAQATGEYQTDLSPLTTYDSTIARSDQRARSVGLADMMEARARGEVPSVAAEQYKAGLDRLLQSQQAAVASQRGPASALALRGAQTQAGQMGQQAVRETAILRLQEQKEAEERAAAQSNLIMIEDQKLSSQEKMNELNQRIQIVSADLQNTRNVLDRDMFNAEAMNKVNMLEAQLRTDVEKLNAEMQTNASLTNAELATRASIASAQNATQASIASADNMTKSSIANAGIASDLQQFAGTQAQQALQAQQTQQRYDWLQGYTVDRDTVGDQRNAALSAATLMANAGAGDLERQRLAANAASEAERLRRLDEAAAAQQTQGWVNTGLGVFNTFAGMRTPAAKPKNWWEL